MSNKPLQSIKFPGLGDTYTIVDIENFASAYSTSSTYSVGEYVTYDGAFYVCITAISTAEAWTPAHWEQVTVGEELSDYKAEINQLEDLETKTISGYLSPFSQGSVNQNSGVIDTSSTTNCYIGKLPMKKGDSFTFSRAVNTIVTFCALAIYNSDGVFLSGRGVTTGTTITFDTDGMFAISCGLNSNVSATMEQAIASANASFPATFDKTEKIVQTVKKNVSDIISINQDIDEMKGFVLTQSDMKTGVYYKVTNGVVSTATETTAKYLPLIDVSAYRGAKMIVWMNNRRSGSIRSLGFCDSQNNVGNYVGESGLNQISDSYYYMLGVDKDYLFFSCSSDPTEIRIEIIGDSTFVDQECLNSTIDNKKYYHMSFDDVHLCLQDITENASTYESVFDNSFLGWCKKMHDNFGTVFSLYVFYQDAETNPTWSLEDVTSSFANEFTANCDWLRFGYHSFSSNSTATSRESTATTDYTNTITQLVRITGSARCIDRIPRLHNYNGTLVALKAMRDCDVGCIGFLASADYDLSTPRDSYYFDADENDYMFKHIYMYDATNHLHFVKTSYLWGPQNIDLNGAENNIAYCNANKYVEVFQHENNLTDGEKASLQSRFVRLSYSHRPCFLMDMVLTN